MSRVKMLAIESSDQRPFWGAIKGLTIAKIYGSRTHGCNLTFDPLKIKHSRASEGNDQAIFPIKSYDHGRKHLNRWHVSDSLGLAL